MIDDRSASFDIDNVQLIAAMCSRRFGIGADGFILLRNHSDYDFEMVYFNSDGRQSSMCGNGGRCLVHFAHSLEVFSDKCRFIAIDGEHLAEMTTDGDVKLGMNSVDEIKKFGTDFILDTGSPHYVQCVANITGKDIKTDGAQIRYSDSFKENGINVNFIKQDDDHLIVATYERGVEDETFSCGTGVTASAIVAHQVFQMNSPVMINTKGGELKVYFKNQSGNYTDIWLEGPAVSVFDGVWRID